MNLKPCNFSWKFSEHNVKNINRDLLPKCWIKLRSCKSISTNLSCRYLIDNWYTFHLPNLSKITNYFTTSSICNWGYGDNFKAVYFFFLRKDSARTKTLKNKKPTNKTKTSKQKNNKDNNFLRAQFSNGIKVACFAFSAFFTLKIFWWKKSKQV